MQIPIAFRAWVLIGLFLFVPLPAAEILKPPADPVLQAFIDVITEGDVEACKQQLTDQPSLANASFELEPPNSRYWGAQPRMTTSLILAVRYGKEKVVQVFLEAGADIRALDWAGNDVLYHALWMDEQWQGPEMVKILITAGVDVNRRYSDGWTPLHYAILRGEYVSEKVSRLLIAAGADIHSLTDDGRTPLGMAVRGRDLTARDNVLLLLDHGAEINRANQDGVTPFMHLAVSGGIKHKTVACMLEHGADPFLRDKSGRTALDRALAEGWPFNVVTLASLHSVYLRVPGPVQVFVYLAVLAAAGVWVWRRRPKGAPWTEAEWAASLPLLQNWQAELPEAEVQKFPDHLQRWQRHIHRQRWAAWTVVAGILLTLFTLVDPIMPRVPTFYAQLAYLVAMCLGYAALQVRARWLTFGLYLLGAVTAGVGVYCLGFLGWFLVEYAEAPWIAGLYFLAGGAFTFQAVLFLVLAWQRFRLLRVEARLKRLSNEILKARENTGIESPGNWDEAS